MLILRRIAIALVLALGVVTATAPEVRADAQSALAAIKNEKLVKSVVYRPSDTIKWHIGVLPDGTMMWGYAMYICQLLREHKAVVGNTWVRVINIVAVANRGASMRKASLGRVNCKTWRKAHP